MTLGLGIRSKVNWVQNSKKMYENNVTIFSFCSGVSIFGDQGSPSSGSLLNLLSPRFLFIRVFIMIYLFVLGDSLTS